MRALTAVLAVTALLAAPALAQDNDMPGCIQANPCEVVVDLDAQGIEIHQSESLLGTQGSFRGYEGLGQAGREVFAVFREAHYVPQRFVDAGHQVVATLEFRGIGKESGVSVSETVAHVWTLKAGRIMAWDVYLDPAEALEAVGLSG